MLEYGYSIDVFHDEIDIFGVLKVIVESDNVLIIDFIEHFELSFDFPNV